MKIKLRLYPRDLDLIALKHNPNFSFNKVVRMALHQYVTTGHCQKVEVPICERQQYTLQGEECNITFNDEVFSEVVNWVNSIRPGMKSAAIKVVIRAAIANPDLELFGLDSDLIIPEKKGVNLEKFKEKPRADNKSVVNAPETPKSPIKENIELEIDDDDWFDNY